MNAPITLQTLKTLIRTRVEPNDTPARQRRNALRAIALGSDRLLLHLASAAGPELDATLSDPASPLYPDRAAIRRALAG